MSRAAASPPAPGGGTVPGGGGRGAAPGLRVRMGVESVHTRGPMGPIMECECLIEWLLRLGAESREDVRVRARRCALVHVRLRLHCVSSVHLEVCACAGLLWECSLGLFGSRVYVWSVL